MQISVCSEINPGKICFIPIKAIIFVTNSLIKGTKLRCAGESETGFHAQNARA